MRRLTTSIRWRSTSTSALRPTNSGARTAGTCRLAFPLARPTGFPSEVLGPAGHPSRVFDRTSMRTPRRRLPPPSSHQARRHADPTLPPRFLRTNGQSRQIEAAKICAFPPRALMFGSIGECPIPVKSRLSFFQDIFVFLRPDYLLSKVGVGTAPTLRRAKAAFLSWLQLAGAKLLIGQTSGRQANGTTVSNTRSSLQLRLSELLSWLPARRTQDQVKVCPRLTIWGSVQPGDEGEP